MAGFIRSTPMSKLLPIPTNLRRHEEGVDIDLSWIDPEDLPEAFLSQSVARQAPARVERLLVPRGFIGPVLPGPSPRLIFHTGRCGSSLICQALKRDGLVFGEPEVFGQLLSPPLGSWRPEELTALAHYLLSYFIAASPKGTVVKFSSWQVLFADLLIPARAPVAFLFREPTAVIESMLQRPPSWATAWLGDGRTPPSMRSRNLEPWQAAALAITGFLEAGQGLQARGHPAFAYEALRPEGLSALQRHFEMPVRAVSDQDWTLDAKDPVRKRQYAPRPSAALRQTANSSAFLEKAVSAYESLRRIESH